jgi:hypothetical protein
MEKNTIVIDDYYRDPDVVRQYAMDAPFRLFSEAEYPGYIYDEKPYQVRRSMKRFSEILQSNLCWHGAPGHFRYVKEELDLGFYGLIHTDELHYAGLIYLNTPQQCRGGTSLYKHKETGIESWLDVNQEMLDEYKKTPEEFIHWIQTESNDLTKWEEVTHVSMVYNRLLIFNTWRFHSLSEPFGKSKRSARLTQNFLFDVCKGKACGCKKLNKKTVKYR